jgi:BirA family biotin operon repressor/biotin-[acetyl-CoA-carboxylase] ligase
MSLRQALLNILADGRFHSGKDLGVALGVSRTAVWKQLKSLEKLGVGLYAVSGKGYRLERPLELLDLDLITNAMGAEAKALLATAEIHEDIDSTNRYLMARAEQGAVSGTACLAERQHAGRWRRGRTWISPFGGNIYLSLLWRFSGSSAALMGLSLAMGVAVARALQDEGLVRPDLKWPNDVLSRGRKLAGILIEMSGEAAGPCRVVIGVGLNVRMSLPEPLMIEQPWINLEEAIGARVSRNHVAGRLLHHLLLALSRFESGGLQAFIHEWRSLDALAGQPIHLQLPHAMLSGIALGVDDSGALVVTDNGVTTSYQAGEVSIRRVS